MNILSLDQASTTGWAYYDKKIIDFGIIVSNKNTSYDARISFIKENMIKLIEKYTPILVTFEGVQYERNQNAYHKLSKLQGVLINYCIEHQILFEIIPSTKWRGALGIKGKNRAAKKECAVEYIKTNYKIETGDDIAEAICMAIYAKENIKIITTKG